MFFAEKESGKNNNTFPKKNQKTVLEVLRQVVGRFLEGNELKIQETSSTTKHAKTYETNQKHIQNCQTIQTTRKIPKDNLRTT